MSLRLDVGLEPVPGYRLVKPLGDGGFGQVWEAVAPGGVHVALKFIRMDDDHAALELRALEVVKNIRHPHLLDVQFAIRVEDRLVIAMPLCDKNLWERWVECQADGLAGIPFDELIEYMRDAGRAIDFLNEPRHIGPDGRFVAAAHRDVKPHNIFLVGGAVKLADLGLAKALEHSKASQTGSMTPAYAAPEIFQRKVSSRSDQWSLAVTYYQLRTGQLPFRGTMQEMMYSILMEPARLDLLPLEEQGIVARALEKEPAARWPTCREFVRALGKTAGVAVNCVLGSPTARDGAAPGFTADSIRVPPPDSITRGDPSPHLVSPDTGREAVAETLAYIAPAKSASQPPDANIVESADSSATTGVESVGSPDANVSVADDVPMTVPISSRSMGAKTPLRSARAATSAAQLTRTSEEPTDRVTRPIPRQGRRIRTWSISPRGARLLWTATSAASIAALTVVGVIVYPWVLPDETPPPNNPTTSAVPVTENLRTPSFYYPSAGASILVSLQSEDVRLEVVSNEPEERIEVIGQGNTYRVQLPALDGSRRISITARREGYRSKTAQVELQSGDEKTLDIKLKPYPSRLVLTGVTEDATVTATATSEDAKVAVERRGPVQVIRADDPPMDLVVHVVVLRPGYVESAFDWRPADVRLRNETIRWKPIAGALPSTPAKPEETPAPLNLPVAPSPAPPAPIPLVEPSDPSPTSADLKALVPDLVRVEPGTFEMGTSKTTLLKLIADANGHQTNPFEDEQPAHEVRIPRAFWIGNTEISVEQFRAFVEDSGYPADARGLEREDHEPVVYVNWLDAVHYCNWLSDKQQRTRRYSIVKNGEKESVVRNPSADGYRLPTEAEWEYACRAGTASRYSFGDYWRDMAAYGLAEEFLHRSDPSKSMGASAVGQLRPNPWGLHDMHGNVAEWCEDWWSEDYYVVSPATDPGGPGEGSLRVVRGGGWRTPASLCRSACRSKATPWLRADDLGFRIVRPVDPPQPPAR